jgi:chemotaxis family two-component system response regulator Rcp1
VDKDLHMDGIRKEELMTPSNRDVSRSVESPVKDGHIAQSTLSNTARFSGEHSEVNGTPDRKRHILLVDDNPADVRVLRMALNDAKCNCELTVIGDGAEALAFVGQQGQKAGNRPPELAVLDWNLPKSNGLDILEALSKTQALANIPVVVMSSLLSPSDLAKVQQFKVARYITKPSTLEEVLRIGFTLKQLVQTDSGRAVNGSIGVMIVSGDTTLKAKVQMSDD